ncbi:MAG: DUF1015 domain-containing protein [Deltaproteobacteria bacterium]|jgi:hypothetical protein|nr:DUF1015 domain-containing protein [Deltaproteobacteria bacterium]
MNLAKLALHVPTVLLPKNGIDLQRWAVIACDQYTSEPEYWDDVETLTAGFPSTLKLIFPEVFLDAPNSEQRIASINETMDRYLADGTLVAQDPGFILLDRKTSHTPSRKGLIVALDLEQYDYRPGSKTLIRATEGTIVDRLPPRIRVRENASIELPHIMVLIDDPDQTVIEPLCAEPLPEVYDFELMKNSGRLHGWRVSEPRLIAQIVQALEKLADPQRCKERYGVLGEQGDNVMLYAMGDGNHSFATAKAIWEQRKQTAGGSRDVMEDPARYALVELVNLHDPGLEFEAIHRVLFNVDETDFLAHAERFFHQDRSLFRFEWLESLAAAKAAAARAESGQHAIPVVGGRRHGLMVVDKPKLTLVVATLQAFLDRYLSEHAEARIDYIHGESAVTRLGGGDGALGFYLPAISKHALFKTIVLDGALPRKTFSMGEADEKRFYLEARKIKP